MIAWTLAVPVALWALIRTFGLEGGGFPLAPLMSYTPYVVPVAVLAATGCALLRRWPATAVAGAAALALLVAVGPRAIGGETSQSEGRQLRVMTANVLKGTADAGSLADEVRDRDVQVLAVQELTPKFAARFQQEGIIREELPYAALSTRDGVIGSGIYSRYPIQALDSGELEFLQTHATIQVSRGIVLDVTSVHPSPPPARRPSASGRRGWSRFPRRRTTGRCSCCSAISMRPSTMPSSATSWTAATRTRRRPSAAA